jgi:hypothetical protein
MWPYLFGSGWIWGVLIALGLSGVIVGTVVVMFAATGPAAPDATIVRQLAEVQRFRPRRGGSAVEDSDAAADAAG